MKIALAQLNYKVGDFEQNAAKIIEAIDKSRSDSCDLVVFSELALCGYIPHDLLEQKDFIDRNMAFLDKIKFSDEKLEDRAESNQIATDYDDGAIQVDPDAISQFAMNLDWSYNSQAELIDTYLNYRENLIGVVQIIDSRHKPTKDDKMMVEWLQASGLSYLIVATKVDKISNNKKAKQKKLIYKELNLTEEDNFTFFSAQNGDGSKEVYQYLDFLMQLSKDRS